VPPFAISAVLQPDTFYPLPDIIQTTSRCDQHGTKRRTIRKNYADNDCDGYRYADISTQPFFGAMGCTAAIVFTCFGAAYGTAKAGVGISAMGVLRPDLIVKSTCAT
jgi:hypothetical protein